MSRPNGDHAVGDLITRHRAHVSRLAQPTIEVSSIGPATAAFLRSIRRAQPRPLHCAYSGHTTESVIFPRHGPDSLTPVLMSRAMAPAALSPRRSRPTYAGTCRCSPPARPRPITCTARCGTPRVRPVVSWWCSITSGNHENRRRPSGTSITKPSTTRSSKPCSKQFD